MIKSLVKLTLKSVCLMLAVGTLSNARTQAADLLPYKGTAAGSVVERVVFGDPASGLPFVRVKALAVGRFTHTGKSSLELNYTARLAPGPGGAPQAIATGTFTLTAADGSTLFGNFTNTQLLGSEDFTVVVHTTGGTGRVAGVTGECSGSGKTAADGTFFYDLVGTISSIGAGNN